MSLQSKFSSFVTETKSFPKKTLVTPPTANRLTAKGEIEANLAFGMSIVEPVSPVTGFPGVNLRQDGLGVEDDFMWIIRNGKYLANPCRMVNIFKLLLSNYLGVLGFWTE